MLYIYKKWGIIRNEQAIYNRRLNKNSRSVKR